MRNNYIPNQARRQEFAQTYSPPVGCLELVALYTLSALVQISTDFKNSFTERFDSKFVLKIMSDPTRP